MFLSAKAKGALNNRKRCRLFLNLFESF
ncbi:hypothetical protein FG877_14840 [Enterococcus casseliflavus]|nr:hypothetical protein [Enterococcus casseliflavus]